MNYPTHQNVINPLYAGEPETSLKVCAARLLRSDAVVMPLPTAHNRHNKTKHIKAIKI
jgi:hypothetical protein